MNLIHEAHVTRVLQGFRAEKAVFDLPRSRSLRPSDGGLPISTDSARNHRRGRSYIAWHREGAARCSRNARSTGERKSQDPINKTGRRAAIKRVTESVDLNRDVRDLNENGIV